MSQAGALDIAGPLGVVEFLEGNTGGPVGPDASNVIFVVGQGNISVVGNPGTNTLTIKDNGFEAWTRIFASQTLAVNNGYFCVSGGPINLLLPSVSDVGDTISVSLIGSTQWVIQQGAGQQIVMGSQQSTIGVGGSLTSTQQGDTFTMVCSSPNLQWVIISSMGNPIIV